MKFLVIRILVVAISIIIAFYEKFTDNKNTKKSNKFNVGLFLLAIVGIVVTAISGFQSIQEKKISEHYKLKSDSLANDFQKRLQNKSDSLIEFQKRNFSQTQKLNDSLFNAKEQIIKLQEEIKTNIIGGTEPCFIDIVITSDKKYHILIVSEAELPIYNAYIFLYLISINCRIANILL